MSPTRRMQAVGERKYGTFVLSLNEARHRKEPCCPRDSWELTWMERFDFVNRANAEYIDRLYEQYQRDPRSVDLTWQAYFAGFEYATGKNAGANGQQVAAQRGAATHSASPSTTQTASPATTGRFDRAD